MPERYPTVVYTGTGWLDLRAAELSGPVTTFVAVAYKSRVTILVPPGLRVEMTGFGVTQGADEEDPGYRLSTDAPVIHVCGVQQLPDPACSSKQNKVRHDKLSVCQL